ncbi:MAG TPA: hypothetical protein VLY63_03975, partial [Anaerolineae bacterium]|nr:hypothetical protein [Anaerolineae bacterium]
MSPERSQYRISFEDVAAHAQEVTIQDGHHVPIVIVEGSKSLGVSSLQDLPETHDERLQMMHAFGQAAAMTGRFGRLQQVFFISEGWMSVAKRDGPPG